MDCGGLTGKRFWGVGGWLSIKECPESLAPQESWELNWKGGVTIKSPFKRIAQEKGGGLK